MNSLNWYNIYKAQDRINLFYFFQKAQDWLISILIFTRESQESDFHNLTFFVLWTKIEFNKEKRHLIGKHIFAKENHNAAMMAISRQIFHKRHNHILLKCYKLRPFDQILKPQTRSRWNLASISLWEQHGQDKGKNFCYFYSSYFGWYSTYFSMFKAN